MRRFAVVFTVFALVITPKWALAQRTIGVGVILGEPTGVSLKLWPHRSSAFDAAVAWSFVNEGALHLHADYLWHNYSLITVEEGELPVYVGVGGRLKLVENDTRLGVRVPVGVDYLFETAPLDLFVEVVPILDLAPASEFRFNGAVGLRYWLRRPGRRPGRPTPK